MTPEQREKRIDRLFPWVAQPAPNFRGTVKSGTEFPKPTCPAGTEPVVQPIIMPDLGCAVGRQSACGRLLPGNAGGRRDPSSNKGE
jgi:hypothetical protein